MTLMSTMARVREIFFSGSHEFRGDLASIQEIAFLLDKQFLFLKEISIATKAAYHAILDDVLKNKHAHDLADGGEKNHIALKILAGEHLKKHGFRVQYEHPFCGYYPDVLAHDASIVVECGHTQNPEKMLAYFRQGAIKKCIQIPYPVSENDEICGYIFTASEHLVGFLDALERKKLQELRAHYGK